MSLIVRGKVWGNTSTLFSKNNVEVSRIEIKKGGYCSKHRHDYKYNLFFVEEGKLLVTIFREDANTTIEDKTILEKHDITYVEPNIFHFFEALEDTIAYEIYWVEIDKKDIIRESVGGMR